MKLLRSMVIAISMYSKIPMPQVEWDEDGMKYALCFFPVVGVVIGLAELAAGSLMWALHTGEWMRVSVLTLIPVLITGGIHLDGFADTVDALSSYGDREKKLEILKDPHCGAFAVIGFVCYFIACMALWSEAGPEELPLICLMFPFSRALSGISVVTFTPAKNSGLLRTFRDGASRQTVRNVLAAWAVAVCAGYVVVSVLLGGSAGAGVLTGTLVGADRVALLLKSALSVAAALAVFLYYRRMSMKQFGGITGDLAGYFLQLCELAMLAVLAL